MTKEFQKPNDETCQPRFFGYSGFGIDLSSPILSGQVVIRHSSLTPLAWPPAYCARGPARTE
jgi:hypothetical protein